MKNIEPPRIIPREGMVGHMLLGQLTAYLNWESHSVELQNRTKIIEALKSIFGDSQIFSNITERDYERLAEATLTIGSKALDRITLRLRMIGKSAGWSTDLDYRTLASVVHTVINQGRKLKNSSAQRKKCVKAVLGQANIKQIETSFDRSYDDDERKIFMENIIEPNFQVWTDKVFSNFRKSNVVNQRFIETYQNEWRDFVGDANRYFFQSQESFNFKNKSEQLHYLTQKYEKYLMALLSDTSKTNLKWAFEKVGSDGKRSDIAIDNGVTVDLKKRPDYFAFIVNIPAELKSNFHEIPLALMNLLEKNPGFKYVDISQPASNSNQIEIQIHDKYDMDQIGIAQEKILKYFSNRF
jgi:hypothetical protein